eukprot:CAMPEP_0117751774 /NCGR_PEP_ID=MMETSP0947-20121206/11185_1 /TAXON_ID=44440 /ORGANISM="Chattonella subsalsa, Strain CCMP2191" /LENGTH=508 /DNA_ID=CAMNT_0005570239 /DNA_START=61 /DNA_END=1584 /DNA_ORIENTATION=+
MCCTLELALLVITFFFAFLTSKASGKFPKDFVFGTSTAAYQAEGAYKQDGKGFSVWDTFSNTPGHTFQNETGNVAVDHYNRFDEDIQLMESIGLKAYRMSIAWSRILPTGHLPVNQAAIDHYNQVFDRLQAAKITPFVTLWHWDTPQGLEDEYGSWLSEEITEDFNTYVDVCFQAFGDRVKHWVTLNEPWTSSLNGYGVGTAAPGRCSDRTKCKEGNSYTEPYIVAHNMLLSHARAVKTYKEKYQESQKGQIGMVLNIDNIVPMDPSSELDKLAGQQRTEFQFAWFADPITKGDYPDSMKRLIGDRLLEFTADESSDLINSFDFMGVNHYTSYYGEYKDLSVTGSGYLWFDWWDAEVRLSQTNKQGELLGPLSDSTWMMKVPHGIKDSLLWIHNRYPGFTSIFITENGCDTPGEFEKTAEEMQKDDSWRIDFLQQYIGNVSTAIDLGVPVKGYFVWSFLDNYEWGDGYSKRFGLVYVDYDNDLKRTPKGAYYWYADLIKKHTPGAGGW